MAGNSRRLTAVSVYLCVGRVAKPYVLMCVVPVLERLDTQGASQL